MALYRCPTCEHIVRKAAKRCPTCGQFFDLYHEPVPDDDPGDSTKISNKEKRILRIVAVAVVFVIVIAVWVSLGNARIYNEAVKRWQREGAARRRNRVAIVQAWDSATKSEG